MAADAALAEGRVEERVTQLTDQVKALADAYADIDRRLLKLEAKFELIEKVTASRPRRALPNKPQK